jgi:hypothetical protein
MSVLRDAGDAAKGEKKHVFFVSNHNKVHYLNLHFHLPLGVYHLHQMEKCNVVTVLV